MLQVYFEYIKNSVMKYTSSILWTCFWNAIVFLFWLRSILKVDFQNLCIYYQTQKYTLSRFSKLTNLHSNLNKGVATNSGLWGPGSNRNFFLAFVSTNVVQKRLMFLHPVNSTEHNIKQNVYTSMEVISVIPPWYCI